jgi:hypothetical protein
VKSSKKPHFVGWDYADREGFVSDVITNLTFSNSGLIYAIYKIKMIRHILSYL